jgi:DNA-binding CsgD family transcriptional regulator/tetratricopeptide (TPR) repeat protein
MQPGCVSARLTSPVMVGRSEQLAILEQCFDRVRSGASATVLVGGDAGAGKTRLITEFASRHAGGATLLQGGCVDVGGDGLAFAPFTAALRGLVRRIGAERVVFLLPGGAPPELGRLLPALGAPGPRRDAETDRARLFEELFALLENLAEPQPVVLVIDDAHWADGSSRDLLSFLVRNLQLSTGLLVLVTYRTDDLGRGHPLRPLLAEMSRLAWVERVELPPLSASEVIAQVHAILGGAGPPALVEEVIRRGEGNPLFVEMLLDSAGRFPESLADLLLARVGQLPDQTQRILEVAALIGRRFGQPLLEAVTGLDDAALSDALRPAVAAGVVVTDGDLYQFHHALIQEAINTGQLPGERKRWHARMAQVLEADPELAPEGGAAQAIAHHWHAAGDAPRALQAAWRAAADAAEAVAYAEQLNMLGRVLELWNAVPDASGLVGADHVTVLEQAVAAAHLAGQPERGVLLADAALEEPGAQADPVRAFFLHERRTAMRLQLRHADLEGLLEAVARIPVDHPARPRALAAVAEQLMDAQMPEEAYRFGDEALAAARRTRDLVSEASALITTAALNARRGELQAQLPRLVEARAIAEQLGATRLLMRALQWEASVHAAYGEHERAAEVSRRGIAAATAAGLARTSGAAHAGNLAEALTALGRWDEALEVIEHALSLLPPPGPRVQLLRARGFISLARGDLDAAQSALLEAQAEAPTIRDGASFGAFEALLLTEFEVSLHAARGDTSKALAVAKQVLQAEGARVSKLQRFLWPLLATTARVARVAATPGAPETLAAAAREVLSLAAAHAASVRPVSPVQQAHAAAFRAVSQAQSAAWDEVASAWERIGEPYRRAQALVCGTQTALSCGEDRHAAADRLRIAMDLAAALGAKPLCSEIETLARRARLDMIRAEVGEPRTADLGLTSRELEVLRLVAEGRDNREIAADLFISAKTASVHVSNILGKLGAHTRVEAAAIAHRAGLVGVASSC